MKLYVVIGMLSGLQPDVILATTDRSDAEACYKLKGVSMDTWEDGQWIDRIRKP